MDHEFHSTPPLSELEEWLEANLFNQTTEEDRTRLSLHSDTDSVVLKVLGIQGNHKLKELVVAHRNAPEELFCRLAESNDSFDRYLVAKSPLTPPYLLTRLADDQNESVRCRVAANERTPEETLVVLSLDESKKVRYHVAANSSAPGEALEYLSGDMESSIRNQVVSNRRTPLDTLRHMTTDSDGDIAQRAVVKTAHRTRLLPKPLKSEVELLAEKQLGPDWKEQQHQCSTRQSVSEKTSKKHRIK